MNNSFGRRRAYVEEGTGVKSGRSRFVDWLCGEARVKGQRYVARSLIVSRGKAKLVMFGRFLKSPLTGSD